MRVRKVLLPLPDHNSTSASAPTASCTVNPAATPATTKPPTECARASVPPDLLLNHHRFPILPEHLPHSVGNLADCRVSLHRRQNPRHHIRARPRRILHPCQRHLPRSRVPPRPQRPHPLHLLRLQRRIDPLNRDRLLRPPPRSGSPPPRSPRSLIHGLLILVRRILNFLLHKAALDRLQHPAQHFNLSQIFRARFSISLVSDST